MRFIKNIDIINNYLDKIRLKKYDRKKDYIYLESLKDYCIRGSLKDKWGSEIKSYLFFKDNKIIKYFFSNMDDERYFWSHRFMLRQNIKLTCACNSSIEEIIKKETYYLEKLKNYKYFPKLIKYNIYNQIMIMEYCGCTLSSLENNKIINIPKNYNKQIKEITEIFIKENIYHNDINASNICIKDNIIKIIDYGCIQRLNILNQNKNFTKNFKSNFNQINEIFSNFINNYNKKINFV